MMDEPPAKRSRGLGASRAKVAPDAAAAAAEASPSAGPILNPALLDPAAVAAKRAECDTAQPYPSCVLHTLGDDAQMRVVRSEIVDNIRATFKETDLFKVLQTGDLKNMDDLDAEQLAKLPALRTLRDELYSPGFRQAVSEMTGCGALTDKTDMSANVYSQGHHLLCHDDVIGTRRVSFIIYLTEPDEPWTAEDGGALELYPVLPDKPGVPDTTPTAAHLPLWNTMAMFTVVPGQSFHAVQEVFSEDKPRLSIQGWYHADEEPSHKELASLSQLKSLREAVGAEFTRVTAGKVPPSEEDLQLLAKWVNPTYLKPETWAKVAATFREENSVQLQDFLRDDVVSGVLKACEAADAAAEVGRGKVPKYDAGSGAEEGGGAWEVLGPPHMRRYLAYKAAAGEGGGAGGALAAIRAAVFESPACARLLGALTDLEPTAVRSEMRRFRPGLDYTVAHYGVLTEEDRLDATLCFVADACEEDAASWEVGEVGGYECYIAAEDDDTGGDVAVYNANDEDDGGLLNVAAKSNTLNLVHRDAGIMRFVKYVGHLAPSSRWDVTVEYRVEVPGDGEGEGDCA